MATYIITSRNPVTDPAHVLAEINTATSIDDAAAIAGRQLYKRRHSTRQFQIRRTTGDVNKSGWFSAYQQLGTDQMFAQVGDPFYVYESDPNSPWI